MKGIYILLLVLYKLSFVYTELKCISPEKRSVDWYVIFKLPTSIGGGLQYAYYDSERREQTYNNLNDRESSPLMLTLE